MKSILFFFSLSFLFPLSALTWTTPIILSDSSNNANIPQIGIDGSGNSIVTWQARVYGSTPIIKVSIKDSGTWPLTPVSLFSDAGLPTTGPALSVNALGNAIILSTFRQDTDYSIKACVLSNGSWLGADDISLPGADDSFEAVSMNNNNNGLAVWNRLVDDKWETQVSLYNDGTKLWSIPTTVSSATETTFNPHGYLDGSENGIVTWTTMINNAASIQATESSGEVFSTPSTISTVDDKTQYSALDGSSSGDAVAVFLSLTETSWNTCANTYSSGAWGTPEFISVLGRNDMKPEVAMNNNGDAIAVWPRRDKSYVEIRAAVFTSGTWSESTIISSPNNETSMPQIAIDDSGRAVAVWKSHDRGGKLIYAASYTPGGGWTAQELISDSTGTFDNPKVTINASGNIAVAWQKLVQTDARQYTQVIQVTESNF